MTNHHPLRKIVHSQPELCTSNCNGRPISQAHVFGDLRLAVKGVSDIARSNLKLPVLLLHILWRHHLDVNRAHHKVLYLRMPYFRLRTWRTCSLLPPTLSCTGGQTSTFADRPEWEQGSSTLRQSVKDWRFAASLVSPGITGSKLMGNPPLWAPTGSS